MMAAVSAQTKADDTSMVYVSYMPGTPGHEDSLTICYAAAGRHAARTATLVLNAVLEEAKVTLRRALPNNFPVGCFAGDRSGSVGEAVAVEVHVFRSIPESAVFEKQVVSPSQCRPLACGLYFPQCAVADSHTHVRLVVPHGYSNRTANATTIADNHARCDHHYHHHYRHHYHHHNHSQTPPPKTSLQTPTRACTKQRCPPLTPCGCTERGDHPAGPARTPSAAERRRVHKASLRELRWAEF